jgi:hypothetical protein
MARTYTPKYEGSSTDWAASILDLANRLDDKYDENTPGYTSFRASVHKWARIENSKGEQPNRAKLIGDWVPKAEAMMKRAQQGDDSDEAIAERRSIRELRQWLADEIGKSTEITP